MTLILKVKLTKDRQLERRKARICVQGNKQVYGEDYVDTFAPCTQLFSMRLVIVLALNLGLAVYHMDVETPFLNSSTLPFGRSKRCANSARTQRRHMTSKVVPAGRGPGGASCTSS